MNCQYCNKSYSNKQNLVKHQKTESCISKQNIIKNLRLQLDDTKLQLDDTKLQLDTAQSEIKALRDEIIRLKTRLEVYSEQKEDNYNYQDELKSLREDNVKLQTRLEIYSEQKQENYPSINITNINTNTKIINQLQVLDLNKTTISKIAKEHFTLDYLKKENRGVAQFTINHVIKDSEGKPKYICTDISRKIAKYKSDDNSIVTDFGMEKLSDTVYDSIRNKVNSLVMMNMAEDFETKLDTNPYYINQLNLNKNSPEFYNHIAKSVYSKNIV